MNQFVKKVKQPFIDVANCLHKFAIALVDGDLFVRLSLVWMGAGFFRRKQYLKSFLITALEIIVILYSVFFASQYIPKFNTLGTVKQESVFNAVTMKKEFNDYDNSFMILLYSLVSIVIWIIFFVIYIRNIIHQYDLQKMAERGQHINTFKDDRRLYLGEKFYVVLLSLPVLGVVLFNIIPLLTMALIAFTNYDSRHMPPTELFTWVGLDNFVSLFSSGGLTITFGYAFIRVLIWTLVWAVFATFTTYIGGILLASLINHKRVRGKSFGGQCLS